MSTGLSDQDRSELLAQCVDVLRTTLQAFGNYGNRHALDRLPHNSPGQRFQQSVYSQHGPAGPWPSDLGERLYGRVTVYLSGSQSWILSMLAMLEGAPYALGVSPIARAAAEASGRVVWLLGNDLSPIGDVRKRVARLMFDEWDEASRRKRIMYTLSLAERAQAGDRYRQALNQITRDQSDLYRPDEIGEDPRTKKRVVQGQQMPGTSEFVTKAAKILGDDTADVDGLYQYLSCIVHPTPFAYAESLVRENIIFPAKLTKYVALSLYNGWRCLAGWTQVDGTETPELDVVQDKHNALNRRLQELTS